VCVGWVLDSYPDLVSFPNSMETKVCLGPPICPVFSGFGISLFSLEGHDGCRSPAAASS